MDDDYLCLVTCGDDPDGLPVDVIKIFCLGTNDLVSILCRSLNFMRIAGVVIGATVVRESVESLEYPHWATGFLAHYKKAAANQTASKTWGPIDGRARD